MRACFNSICHGIHLDLYVLFGVFFYSTCSYTNAHIIAITVNALSLSKLSENMFCLRHRAPLIAMKQITYLITFVCASHCSNLIYVFPFLLLFFSISIVYSTHSFNVISGPVNYIELLFCDGMFGFASIQMISFWKLKFTLRWISLSDLI